MDILCNLNKKCLISDVDGTPLFVKNTHFDVPIFSDIENKLIDDGSVYRRCYLWDNVPDGNNADFVFTTPSGVVVHLNIDFSSEATAMGYFYENPEYTTTSGNYLAGANFNRRKKDSNPPTSTVYKDPTVSNTGDFICGYFFSAGTGNKTFGGRIRNSFGWVLEEGTPYLVRLNNRGGAAKDLFMALEWIEIVET